MCGQLIKKKKDSLWLKWIHHLYLKGGSVWEHEAPSYSSWTWRKLVSIMKEAKDAVQRQHGGNYSITQGYKWFCDAQVKVRWDKQVWNRLNLPKHSFIMWLAVQDRLNTRARIQKYHDIEASCVFCGCQTETKEHILFRCHWSKLCLEETKTWLDWKCQEEELTGILRWVQRKKTSKLRKQVWLASLAALIYNIWKMRNEYIWGNEGIDSNKVLSQVKNCVKTRIGLVYTKTGKCKDELWRYTL